MANLKKKVGFFIQWVGNGSDSQVVVKFLTDPVFISPPSGYGFTFDIASSLPADIANVAVGGATLSTATYNVLVHELTVTFTAAPANGTVGTISGDALYA